MAFTLAICLRGHLKTPIACSVGDLSTWQCSCTPASIKATLHQHS